METKSKWSEKDTKPKEWQWVMMSIFYIPAIILTIVGSSIMKLGNVLMFDTHHLEIKVIPKKD